jgi:hypothetical protein
MRCRPIAVSWLSVLAVALWANPVVSGQWSVVSKDKTASSPSLTTAWPVPLDEIAPGVREQVRQVLEKPTLVGHGPPEVFVGRPALYHWLLEHPDRAARAWRRLGAQCMTISDRGGGRFGWIDGHGSDVSWHTVYRGPRLRVWLAEGKVRPAPLLPLVPVRILLLLHHTEGHDSFGRSLIRHHADVVLQTDSKTAALATRMLGASAPRLAEQCLAQLEMFFAALTWYLDQHPEQMNLLAD